MPNTPVISVQMTDEDVVSRIATLFGNRYHKSPARKSHWKDTYLTRLQGERAVALMKELHPLMGLRRQRQIDRALQSWGGPKRVLDMEKVDSLLQEGKTQGQVGAELGFTREAVNKALARRKALLGPLGMAVVS